MPKILLLLSYTVLVAFLMALFVMHKEVRRIGLFSSDKAASPSAPSRVSPSSPQPKTTSRKEKTPVTEVTTRERKGTTPAPPTGRKETLPPLENITRKQQDPAHPTEEITQEEKNRLDDILRGEADE